MNSIEVVRKVLSDGCHVFRERRDEPGQYDAKPYFSGNKRGWTALDSFSASAIVAVYDALKPENQVKYVNLPIVKMAHVAMRLVK